MDLIDQAVFTSAETDRAAGYQVVATSGAVCEADVRELAAWGPSHDALLDSAANAVSFNFHPLPSGAYCVSRTTPAGWEYSGRGGARIYTQCLIVSPEVLAQFANNPFALLRAALASGSLRVYDEVPKELKQLHLSGRAATVDVTLLDRLCTHPGPEWLAALVQAALGSATIAVAGGPPAEQVIAGLINCLPPECRTEFSFSTGLKFSSRRPFRVVALSGEPAEQRRVERLYHLTVLDLSGHPPADFAPIDSWACFIHRVLKSRRASFLAARLAQRHLECTPEDLSALGLQLLEELDASSLQGESHEEESWIGEAPDANVAKGHDSAGPKGIPPEPAPAEAPLAEAPLAEVPVPPRERQRMHQPHRRTTSTARSPAATQDKTAAPSTFLEPDSPQVLEMLEELDDLVFEAIAGTSQAMDELKSLWPRLRYKLGDRLLAESREQYLRYALSIWNKCVEPNGVRHSARAPLALDVLCLLFDEES